MTGAELPTLGTIAGVGFAFFLAAIGAAVAFGRLTQRVVQVEGRLDAIDARLDRIETAINELRAEMEQTNRILIGLANHRHDTDGNTVFTIPQA
ncbi:MAG: hypothetical protein F4X64_03355 [Chloroflexi bacterium]|nr:hypothetical protein [Chloroflexota bacterium]